MPPKHATGATLHTLFKEVFMLHATLTEISDEVHEQAGMRTPQVRVAHSLLRRGRATVPDVAYDLKVSRQFVQATINELESLGMVSFHPNPRHKSSKLIELTPSGQNKLEQTTQREEAIIQNVLPQMESKSVEDATELLESVRLSLHGHIVSKPNDN